MIGSYLTTPVTWHPTAAANGFNEPVAGTRVETFCRQTGKRSLVRNAQGEQVTSDEMLIVREHIKEGDKVTLAGRKWPVVAAFPATMLNGKPLFWAAYL